MIELFQTILLYVGIIYVGVVLFLIGIFKFLSGINVGDNLTVTDAIIWSMKWPYNLVYRMISTFKK